MDLEMWTAFHKAQMEMAPVHYSLCLVQLSAAQKLHVSGHKANTEEYCA